MSNGLLGWGEMRKKSNTKRNVSGSHHGKKGKTPYKFYMDKDKIIKLRNDADRNGL